MTQPNPNDPTKETQRERKNRLARERRKERRNYNSSSKGDRLHAYEGDCDL